MPMSGRVNGNPKVVVTIMLSIDGSINRDLRLSVGSSGGIGDKWRSRSIRWKISAMAYHPTTGSARRSDCEVERAGAVIPEIEQGIRCYSFRDRKLDVDGMSFPGTVPCT